MNRAGIISMQAMARCALIAIVACSYWATSAHALTTNWINSSGGFFTTPSNWGNGVPDSDDLAAFNAGAAAVYSVTFPGGSVLNPPPNYVIDYLRVHSNNVTFRDNSSPFITIPSLTVVNPDISIAIGVDAGDVAVLNTSLRNFSGAKASIGRAPGANGTLNVTAGNLSMSSNLDVGDSGTGTLNITAGGRVQSGISTFGTNPSGEGHATICGAGSTLTNSIGTQVGRFGAGTLRIENGGSVLDSIGHVGFFTGSTGTAT